MKPSRIKETYRRIAGTTCLAAVLLSLAALYAASPADAADGRPTRAQVSRADHSAMPISPRGVVERRQIVVERRMVPQAATGGTVVLRGSRSTATPTVNLPGPNMNGAGYGTSRPLGPVLQPSAGWDRELDYGGLDYGGSVPFTINSP